MICQAALWPRGASLRRRAPCRPAASLHYAGVRVDGSPPRPSSGRHALSQKPAHGGRRRDMATPRLQRPFGGAASLGPSAGVRSTLGFCPPKPAGTNTTARRPASKRSRRCTRRVVEGRRVGHFHSEVVAAARWGAAGLDTREQPRTEENHDSMAGAPEPRAQRIATSRHGGASRGFPSARRTGVRQDAITRSARPRGLG
jgi:hypothetical protein